MNRVDHAARRNASRLSLHDKLAQLIFVRIGSNLPPVQRVEDDAERVAELLARCPVGGLLLFNGGPQAAAALMRLQANVAVPLLVGADVERGVGQQVQGFTLFPHAMAFDQLGEEAAAAVAEFARTTAREAHEVGIHISFSPVADVNTNPRNPIIATRAFSENAARAGELAAAYVAAAEAAGLVTTAKHFPGHGDTHQDSHDSLPSVARSQAELESCELVPFHAAIDAGCSLVMTAHVAFPVIDPSGQPATLSPVILQQLLRDRLRFRGVVCSDSLLMAGVRDRFATEGEMALAALTAGVDLLLDVREPVEVVDYLCERVASGVLSPQRVDEAFARVWALKQRVFGKQLVQDSYAPSGLNYLPLPLGEGRGEGQSLPLPLGEGRGEGKHVSAKAFSPCSQSQAEATANNQLGNPAAQLAERVARGATRIVGASRPALPLNPDAPLVAILLKPFETAAEPPEQPLAAALRSRFQEVDYRQLGPRASAESIEEAWQLARSAQQLLVAMIVRPAAWHAFGLRPEQRDFLLRMTRERDVVLASLGVPYALADYPDAAVRICTFSDVPVSQQALAEYSTAGI